MQNFVSYKKKKPTYFSLLVASPEYKFIASNHISYYAAIDTIES